MNSKHAFVALSIFALVSIAHGEREVFAPSKLAPLATGTRLELLNPSTASTSEIARFRGDTASTPYISFFNGATRIGVIQYSASNLFFIGDANKGVQLSTTGTGEITQSTNGAERMRIASDGQVYFGNGVTNATPNNGFLRATNGQGTNIGGANLSLYSGAGTGSADSGVLTFHTASPGASGSSLNSFSERMRITSNGNVFIGNGETAASTANGNINATGGSGTNIAGADLNLFGGRSTGNAIGGAVRLFTAPAGASGSSLNAAVERMRIDSTGRVGVGTTNPAAALHVVNSNLVQQFRIQDTETDTTNKVGVMGVGHYTNSQAPMSVIFGRSQATTNDVSIGGNSGSFNAATQITLHTAANNTTLTGTERMRIDSAGNVGIGTNTNLSTLTINGPIAPKGPTDVNAATYTVATTDSSLRFTTTNCTVTLPTASSFPGRILWLNTVTANSVTSNASNVIPLGSNTAGTAIFAATAGKFTMIQSNGTNWVTMMSN